jgi:hypothetical protein
MSRTYAAIHTNGATHAMVETVISEMGDIYAAVGETVTSDMGGTYAVVKTHAVMRDSPLGAYAGLPARKRHPVIGRSSCRGHDASSRCVRRVNGR